MIRAIIFDCYGVLYRSTDEELLDRCASEEREAVRGAVAGYRHGLLDAAVVANEVAPHVNWSESHVREVLGRGMVRNEALIEWIYTLRESYTVALMSNIGRSAMDAILSPDEQARLFDGVFLSSELGMSKPDAAIYVHASATLGVPPQDCLLVDDSVANIEGAQATGMQGVVFATTGQLHEAMATYGVGR